MTIESDQPLRNFSTMRLGGNSAHLAHITGLDDLEQALSWAKQHSLPTVMIGGGSNIIWQDAGYQGLVMVNDISGLKIEPIDSGHAKVSIGAGENWDAVVAKTVEAGLTGIEALSLIPGKAGATPIQNVGAYGQEIAETLIKVSAYDKSTDQVVDINNQDCQFGYRTSRFKTTDKGRFLILSIELKLTYGNPKPPYYSSVATYFKENDVTDVTPAKLRQAVIAIRSAKLPDPSKVANCGSFFHNPIIPEETYNRIKEQYAETEVPHWPTDGGIKLSAAWLIEQANYADYKDQATGMATWPAQPLVFVNERARSTADLFSFRDSVAAAVKAKFGIELVQEPETMPT